MSRHACESCDKKYAASPPDALPVMLPCLHRFCHGCIVKFVGGDGQCISPGCGMLIPSVLGLPVDTVSLRVCNSRADAPLCGVCLEDAATSWCSECSKCFCDDGCHPKKGIYKTHTLVPMAEHLASGNAVAAAPASMCWKHTDQPIKVYCSECGVSTYCLCHVEHTHPPVGFVANGGVTY